MSKQRLIKDSLLVAGISLYLISYLPTQTVLATTSSDDNYSIEVNDVNLGSDQPSQPPPRKILPKQILPQKVFGDTKPTYTIDATNDMFSLAISQIVIDFGPLTATNPVTRTTDVSFSTPFYGAQIFGYENHALTNSDKITIPDTTCDTGTCTQTIPSSWDNNLTYGLGYRCDSESKGACGTDFSSSSNYKQLANTSANESPTSIILNGQDNRTTAAQLTYKVNISGTQQAGGYSNTVTLLAVPNF